MKQFKKTGAGDVIVALIIILFIAGGFIRNGENIQVSQIADKIKVFAQPKPTSAITIRNAALYKESDKKEFIVYLEPNISYGVLDVTRYESNDKIAMVKIKYKENYGWVSTNDVRLESEAITKRLNKDNN